MDINIVISSSRLDLQPSFFSLTPTRICKQREINLGGDCGISNCLRDQIVNTVLLFEMRHLSLSFSYVNLCVIGLSIDSVAGRKGSPPQQDDNPQSGKTARRKGSPCQEDGNIQTNAIFSAGAARPSKGTPLKCQCILAK
jgi:hypothetical protein